MTEQDERQPDIVNHDVATATEEEFYHGVLATRAISENPLYWRPSPNS